MCHMKIAGVVRLFSKALRLKLFYCVISKPCDPFWLLFGLLVLGEEVVYRKLAYKKIFVTAGRRKVFNWMLGAFVVCVGSMPRFELMKRRKNHG